MEKESGMVLSQACGHFVCVDLFGVDFVRFG